MENRVYNFHLCVFTNQFEGTMKGLLGYISQRNNFETANIYPFIAHSCAFQRLTIVNDVIKKSQKCYTYAFSYNLDC